MKQKTVSMFQSVYYVITGAWPVVHIESFLMVTGPKTDIWLVKMVGLLTLSIAIALFYSVRENQKIAFVLGTVSAVSYTIIDVYYSLNDVISNIYLADAAVEIIIISLLLLSRKSEGKE